MRTSFTLAIFSSAFLLFLIQPMMSKLVLPHLGGSPAVWQTSIMFYQALLLCGYLYAHLSHRIFGNRGQIRLQLVIVGLSLICLPLTLKTAGNIDPSQEPVMWLLVALLFSVGMPFFLLASNSPMMQHWFAQLPDEAAENPYFLYSASNLGSFIALLGYPFLLEPLLSIPSQMNLWSFGYLLFVLMIGLNGIRMLRKPELFAEGKQCKVALKHEPVTWGRRLHWLLLAFVPSSLMLGVTTYVTTDIAAVPMIWVIPLALYLLSFVLCFRPRMPGYAFCVKEQVAFILAVVIIMGSGLEIVTYFRVLHFVALFMVAMVCHGQLVEKRPDASRLTEFYLIMSLGGVLGGIFNALIAPGIFITTFEYPLMLVLACLLRPGSGDGMRARVLDVALPAAAYVFFRYVQPQMAIWLGGNFSDLNASILGALYDNADEVNGLLSLSRILFYFIFCVLIYRYMRGRPLRFALSLALLMTISPTILPGSGSTDREIIHQERNFFGTSIVMEFKNIRERQYRHGTTLHGIQSLNEEFRLRPGAYYYPLIDVLMSLDPALKDDPVAIAGLGAGTLACFGHKGQTFDMFEIDPAVVRIAENPDFFTYMRDCPPDKKVLLGDARLEIAKMPEKKYGLIVMDAFTSDAVPVHLLTREAAQMYLEKLKPGGVVAFHISNRHLNLAPVLAEVAGSLDASIVGKSFALKGTVKAVGKEKEVEEVLDATGKKVYHPKPSAWVVIARRKDDLKNLKEQYGWVELKPSGKRPWTDHYSNIFSVMRH